jgi:hypothetical protein
MSSRSAAPDLAIPQPEDGASAGSPLMREIARQLDSLRFGSIEIVVHEGSVTQIERREKVRVSAAPPNPRR